jgi:hypothetical protein
MSTRNTWCDRVGTSLVVFVSLLVAASLVLGLLAFWCELRAPGPSVDTPYPTFPNEPPE